MEFNKMVESFKIKYESFLAGCDAFEEKEKWQIEQFGEMDVYFSNEITSVVIRLVAADGLFMQREADFLNGMFDIGYTVDELKSIYDECGEWIEDIFAGGINDSIMLMANVSRELAVLYRELVALSADIIIASDLELDEKEKCLAAQLKENLINL